MKTKSKTPAVDLATCKIGQNLKLRNGGVVQLEGDDGNKDCPYHGSGGKSWTKYGMWAVTNSAYDVVAILPLPKKEAKKKSSIPTIDRVRRKITKLLRLMKDLEDSL